MSARPTIESPSLRHFLPGLPCRNVLCWVESVEEEDRVVRVARALAALGNGSCHIVMGLDSPRRLAAGSGGGEESGSARAPAPLTPELIGLADTKLAALYGRGVATMVLPGHPVYEVRRFARTRGIDLIVIGEQGLAVEREYDARVSDDPPCAVMSLVLPPARGERHGRGRDHCGSDELSTFSESRRSER